MGKQTNTYSPLQEEKKTTGQIYDATVTSVLAAYKAVWALNKPSKRCEAARPTGSVSPLKCGTGRQAGHTQRPQLACVVSISYKLLSLNLSFTQLTLSKISV